MQYSVVSHSSVIMQYSVVSHSSVCLIQTLQAFSLWLPSSVVYRLLLTAIYENSYVQQTVCHGLMTIECQCGVGMIVSLGWRATLSGVRVGWGVYSRLLADDS